ncbi:MAG: hypothetical protein ACP5D9_12025, partial [Mariniphaga sp.]
MKKFLLLQLFLFCAAALFAQDFFRQNFDTGKKYILLADPTTSNIETVNFLVNNGLLDINLRKFNFVGIYAENQNYDFEESLRYIEQNKLSHFKLHAFRGNLDKNRLFERNNYSEELRGVFQNSVGIFFFGGPDIPADVYGEENTFSEVTDPERHYFEATFLFHLLGGRQNENFKPFLEENPEYFVTG